MITTNLPPAFSPALRDRTQDAHLRRPDLLIPEVEALHASVNSKFKRFIDILGASVGLLMTLLIAIPIAIAIQLDNPLQPSSLRCEGQTLPHLEISLNGGRRGSVEAPRQK